MAKALRSKIRQRPTRSARSNRSVRSNLAVLEAANIRHFDKDFRKMTRAELAESFGAKSSGRILLVPLIKNIIWQAYERIKDGQEPPIDGNIRTFWYSWVKPVLAHFPDEDEAKTDPYDTRNITGKFNRNPSEADELKTQVTRFQNTPSTKD